jgi:hypothetical protein
MAALRRRLIRPASAVSHEERRQQRIQKWRARLVHERVALSRWQTRLKRAFTTVEKCQRNVARLEKQLTYLEDPSCPASSR